LLRSQRQKIMHHKKIFATIALGLVTAVLSLSNPANAANLNQAVNTLPQNEEWSIMARAAIGQNSGQTFLRSPISNGSATDYEKRILAITALDENPRTFGSENFVEKLESFFDGNQIGDSSLLNDDIFGVLALTSAGISNNTVSKSRQFILSHQNSDGGWGFATSVGSDSNTTAMAVAALFKTGGVPDSAFNYISSAQDSSGGYAFIPNTAPDGASTAWVIAGLNSAGRNAPANAIEFLNSLQLPNGSFKWKPADNTGSSLVTAYAVIALSGHGVPIRTIQDPQPTTPPPAPNPPTVQLCVDINYAGGCQSFTSDDPDLRQNPIGNDTASSVIVPAGQVVALYEHINFAGRCEEFRTNNPDLRNSYIGNDTASSLTIGKNCPRIVTPPAPIPPPLPVPPALPPPPPIIPANPTIHVTITYPENKIFVGDVNFSQNKTALEALIASANQINLLYEIKQTGLGQFVSSIDGYRPTGVNGWQYAVNGSVPSIGAADYILMGQDTLQWFYGAPGSLPY